MKTRAENFLRRYPTLSMAGLKFMIQERRRAAVTRAGVRVGSWIDRVIVRYSLVGNAPILDAALFPWTADLERNWQTIRKESERVLEHREAIPLVREIAPDNDSIAMDNDWRSFLFWGYEFRCDENCRRCPETARLLGAIPGIQTAFLSILNSRANIPRHQGVTKAVLTCHLGLCIPQQREDCRIEVGGHMYAWREGGAFVFDDMYDHEVWNDTDEERVVLLIYFERPVRFPGSLLRAAALAAVRRSPYVRDGRRSIEAWARKARDQGLS